MSELFVHPNGTKLNSLLYADDLIILSRSKTGLPKCPNALSSYCETWMLNINPLKTKIMAFQKCPRKSVDCNFEIGTEPIEIVQEYTYLGTRLTPTGNFTFAQEHLKENLYTPSLVYENIHFFIDLIPIPHHRFLARWYFRSLATTVRYGGCTLTRILKNGTIPQ